MDPLPPTAKAQRTRQRILDAALRLFAAQGYEGTTMRDIAAEAGCSLGLAYRYFASKEELVREVYRWLIDAFVALVPTLPDAALAERFDHLMRDLLQVMAPQQRTLAALFGAALNPQSQAGLFGAAGLELRQRARAAYVAVVAGASDAPRQGQIDEFATLLYGGQLAVVVFWLQDLSEGAQKTYELLGLIHDLLQRARLFLRLSGSAQLLLRAARIFGPMFGDAEPDRK